LRVTSNALHSGEKSESAANDGLGGRAERASPAEACVATVWSRERRGSLTGAGCHAEDGARDVVVAQFLQNLYSSVRFRSPPPTNPFNPRSYRLIYRFEIGNCALVGLGKTATESFSLSTGRTPLDRFSARFSRVFLCGHPVEALGPQACRT